MEDGFRGTNSDKWCRDIGAMPYHQIRQPSFHMPFCCGSSHLQNCVTGLKCLSVQSQVVSEPEENTQHI